ncbi:MAG: hypothetical protein ACTHJL_09870, partial [Amnibacterium sp.]
AEVLMLEPAAPPPVALVDAVAALARTGEALPAPPAVLDGWASLAALDYEATALRITAGLEGLRLALTDAATALGTA